MKKITYNKVDVFIKELIVFFSTLLIFLFGATYLIANDFNHKVIFAEGRSVIINGDEEIARKRALDDALYLASLQAGAKVDGYSNVDMHTNLKENLLVRPLSTIKDFVILEEKTDETHYLIKIKAFLISSNDYMNCSKRENINLSYFKPHYTISSKLPAWSQKLPKLISQDLFENLKKIDQINILDSTHFDFTPSNPTTTPVSLDYESIVEGKSKTLKSGEFGIHPEIKIRSGKGRLNRFSDEAIINIKLDIYNGSDYKIVDSIKYQFSLFLGNVTGYKHIDAFYKVPVNKLVYFLERSISKLQFRVLDQLKCYPLEAKAKLMKNTLVVPLGTDQGLKTGKVGFISKSNPDISMQDWVVVTVSESQKDYSIIEALNPSNKKEDINGKVIRFLN